MFNRIPPGCAPRGPSDCLFALSQAALADAGRHHVDGHADEHAGRTGHLLRPSSPTSPAGPRSVGAGVRPSARQAVPNRHSRPQRLAHRARRNGQVCAALADQILFGLFLPGPDLMLAASLHNVHECGERQFLFEHLDRLSPDDLLLLDRGYPCRWLVAVLNDRAIKFCMRVDNTSGFACVRTFMRSNALERVVMLPAPNKRDAIDYECPRKPQRVRLVRNVSPGGEQRVLMTNLFDEQLFPADCFAELYHKRWGIEEAFKRLKHRLNLEHVTGLTQQAVAQDVAAKIVCDNLQALVALTAHADANLPDNQRVNHAYAHTALKPLLPILLVGGRIGRKVGKLLRAMLDLIAARTYRHRENLSKPRVPGRKPHKAMSQKNC